MDQQFRQMLHDRDEVAFDDAYFEDECPHFFSVDWREDDDAIVEYCAKCLGLDLLSAEWRDDALVIIRDGNETPVPLTESEADRHITICTLNEVLQDDYQIRYLVCSHGSDTAGFAALPVGEWQALEEDFPEATAENFVRLQDLPNVFTELTDNGLPASAYARFQRMIERNKKG